MSTSKEYLNKVIDGLAEIGEVAFKPMMGEYILYYRNKVIGGLYDDRFLVKVTRATEALYPNLKKELPYPGAKEMFRVEKIDDKEYLSELLGTVYCDLPEKAGKKR